MRAEELLQEAAQRSDKLEEENEALQHRLVQANAAAEEILQQATQRSSYWSKHTRPSCLMPTYDQVKCSKKIKHYNTRLIQNL